SLRGFASGSRTVPSLDDADCLHRCAEVGVGFDHELRVIIRSGINHAETALSHELVIFLAGGDLPYRGNKLVASLGRDALRRGNSAPSRHGPSAAGGGLQRRNV